MLHLIYGISGSGKTDTVATRIADTLPSGRPSYLLVPEQYTLVVERDMARRLPPSAPLSFEVTNFSRLSNTAFRRVGGLSYRYATAGTRNLFMWRTLSELLPLLSEGGELDIGRVRRSLSAVKELRRAGISAAALDRAAEALPKESHLGGRMHDLSLILTLYHGLLTEHYSDADDDLDRLYEVLKKDNLFSDAVFFADSFTSFTEVEYKLLMLLARDSEVTVTLPLPADAHDLLSYDEPKHTRERLLSLALRAEVPYTEEFLGENRRTASPLLRHIEDRLWKNRLEDSDAYRGEREPDACTLVTASDPYAAADFVSADIRRRVMNGARYRDFSVVAAQAERYAGILDRALEKHEIPFYMSTKVDITSFEAIKFIFAAYSVIQGNYRTKDVISFLKCGMCPVEARDMDRFELYVTKWRISGKRKFTGGDFTMNPDGYTSRVREGHAAILASVNRARREVILPLISFEEATAAAVTVEDHCRALVQLLLSLRVPETLRRRSEEAKAAGELRLSADTARLWEVITECLDSLVDALADASVSRRAFPDLLRLVFSEAAIGQIPSSADAVTVGSAAMLRTSGTRHVYLFGLNDGEFPSPPSEGSVFSDADRRVLEELGLPLHPDLSVRASRELYAFLRAFSSASESVTAITMQASSELRHLQPSNAFRRLAYLSGDLGRCLTVTAQATPETLYARMPAIEALPSLRGTAEGALLSDLLSSDPVAARRLSAAETPVTDDTCRVSARVMEELYKNRLSLSQSRMDSYVNCPFSYFCTYVLGLDRNEPADFSYRDMGSFMHALLERLFRYAKEKDATFGALSDDELSAAVEEAARAYADEIGVTENGSSPRLLHLLRRLKRSGSLVAEELRDEFRASDFIPVFAEMDLSGDGTGTATPVSYRLSDGTVLTLSGKVDRVDAFTHDGDVYLRVVDYKTGSKSFSLSDVKSGLNMQLLIYLFSLWKSKNAAFRASLGLSEGGRILPAGVLYMEARTADVTLSSAKAEEEVKTLAKGQLLRNGLLLNDLDVLSAMEHELSGRYAPVKLGKDGTPKGCHGTELSTMSDMETLMHTVDETVVSIGERIKSGEADARPLRTGYGRDGGSCEYCPMKAICRRA